MSIYDKLKNPDIEMRGMPFWSWNDTLTEDELRRQIREMKKAGMGGFFMHARTGLITPYLSKEYFDMHKVCVDEAEKQGMVPWLYDEDCWPSGAAGGIIEAKGEQFQQKYLDFAFETNPKMDRYTVAIYDVERDGDDIKSYRRTENAAGEKLVFRWVPNGYIDILDANCVKAFIETAYDLFDKVFEGRTKEYVRGVFTDEPNFNKDAFSPRAPWTNDFELDFAMIAGYELLDRLPELVFDVGDYKELRHDYYKTASIMFTYAYANRIYDWCDERGLEFTGHYLLEDDLQVMTQHIGAAMPLYMYEHIPGIDHLCRRIIDPMLVKQVSSVAAQTGRKRVLSEMYGCTGWNTSFEDYKRIAQWQYVLGVNLTCEHLCQYTMRKHRKRDYPASIFYQSPWWHDFKAIEDMFARVATAMTSGDPVAKILVIHPMESAWCEYDVLKPSESLAKIDKAFKEILTNLSGMHIDYELGDEQVMYELARVEDGKLRVGERRYDMVIIPPCVTLRGSTLRMLRRFAGPVILCGNIPERVDGSLSDEASTILAKAERCGTDFDSLKSAVTKHIKPTVTLTSGGGDMKDVFVREVVNGSERYIYFANLDNGDTPEVYGEVHLAGKGLVREVNLLTGDAADIPCRVEGGETAFDLRFAPVESHLIIFDTDKEPVIGKAEKFTETSSVELAGPWTMKRSRENALTLDFCRYKVGDGDWSQRIHTIHLTKPLADVRGKVTLAFDFVCDFKALPEDFTLAIEDPDKCEVYVNGTRVEYADGWYVDTSFKTIKLKGLVKNGDNRIEVVIPDYIGKNEAEKEIETLDIPRLKGNMRIHQGNKATVLLPFEGEAYDRILRCNNLRFGYELESVYLLGDFRVREDFVLTDDSESVIATDFARQGYPFFSGTFICETEFDAPGDGRAFVDLSGCGSIVAKVYVNDEYADTVLWRPKRGEITDFARPGKNKLRIEFTTSNRNLLGPHHHIEGELTAVGPDSFMTEGGGWTDEYSFVPEGLAAVPKVIFGR